MTKLTQAEREQLGREYMRMLAAKGGSKTGPTKARDPEKMREAGKKGALKRWWKKRSS